VQAGAAEYRGGREVGGQRFPAWDLRRRAGELILDFLVDDRRAERAGQDGLGDEGDALPGASGAVQVPQGRAETGRDEDQGAGGGDTPGTAGHPLADKGGEVHSQREGLAELAGVAAGLQDAHPFLAAGQIGVAVDRAQGLGVPRQEERPPAAGPARPMPRRRDPGRAGQDGGRASARPGRARPDTLPRRDDPD
jgi:hypothetical protein